MDVKQPNLLSRSALLSPGTVTIIFTVLALVYLVYRSALPRPLPGIPYDEKAARSLFGNLPEIMSHIKSTGTIFPWLAAQNAKYNSPLFQFWQRPFSKPLIILTDFQEIQDILLRRTKEFDRSQIMIDVFRGGAPEHHIAMRTADPRFKGNKELVRDLMSPSFLHATSAPEIHRKTMTLVQLWSLKAKMAKGRPFAAHPDMFNAAMDMVNAAAFAFNDSLSGTSHQLDHLASLDGFNPAVAPDGSVEFPQLPTLPDLAAFITIFKAGGVTATSPMPMLTHRYQIATKPKLRRALAHRDRVLDREIQKSLGRMEEQSEDVMGSSAVENILRREKAVAAKEGRQPDFYSERVRNEIFGYVLAGHETSMTALLWSLKYLSDHQRVQRALREALRKAYSAAAAESRQPTADEIVKTNIPYLDAVMEECLRMGNPVRILHREAMVDTTLLGHKIPKGTTVFLCNDGPGFKKPVVPVDDSLRSSRSALGKYHVGAWDPQDLHLFKPERWLTEGKNHDVVFDPNAGPVLAFSLGPRGCFGRKLAYMEIRMVMVLLIWNFSFRELEGEMASHDIVEGITTMPKRCFVSLEELSWQET